ncbi:hypothetical protein AMJ57_04850 [Parcubacteria bacterium SG8_24]|nr:MAG: hypothetical protein AMJ57_04850 [Parcubacteria bacterium SG8_24]
MHIDEIIKRKDDEEIIFFLRRDVIIFIGAVLLILVLALVPLLARFIINAALPHILTDATWRPAILLLASAYYLLIWLFFFTQFVDYYLDAWIITDDRVVSVEQHGLFSRTVSELDLAKVQDVTSEIHGVIPYIFNFGNVYVQTAGEKERFVFEQVPKPHEVRKHILELVEKDRRKQGETLGSTL